MTHWLRYRGQGPSVCLASKVRVYISAARRGASHLPGCARLFVIARIAALSRQGCSADPPAYQPARITFATVFFGQAPHGCKGTGPEVDVCHLGGDGGRYRCHMVNKQAADDQPPADVALSLLLGFARRAAFWTDAPIQSAY